VTETLCGCWYSANGLGENRHPFGFACEKCGNKGVIRVAAPTPGFTVGVCPPDDLIEALRRVGLLTDPTTKPYADARIDQLGWGS
jgi:hypothetical protein